MASLKRRNGIYYGQWSDASRTPKLRRHSLRTRVRRTAQALLDRADDAYRLNEWDPWVQRLSVLDVRPSDPIKLSVAVEAFLEARKNDLRPVTLENYASMLRRFATFAGESSPLARLSSNDIAGFVRAPEIAPATMQTRLVVLQSFCSWGLKQGHLRTSPARQVSAPAPPPRLPRAVRVEELGAIVQAIRADQTRRDGSSDSRIKTDRTWLIPCFRFAALTGLRAAELAGLRWRDIDAERLLVILETQKSGKAGTVPLTSPALAELNEVVGDRHPDLYVFCPPCSAGEPRNVRAFSTNLNRYFRSYVDAAGIARRLTLHGLRHGFCTRLAEVGASAFVIQAAARHASVKTSQVYVSISNDHLREELERLSERRD